MADKVLELVVFKLNPGAGREQLLATSEGVSRWAEQQPGFVSRELTYDAEGDRWVDVVWWRSLADAKAAAEAAYVLGRLEEQLGDMDKAEKLYRQAVKTHQGSPDESYRYRIALARLLLRDRPAAAPQPARPPQPAPV